MCGTNVPAEVNEFRFGLAGQVVRCPWHHYEFDLATGRCLVAPDRLRVATYQVAEEGDDVVINLRARREPPRAAREPESL